MKTELFMSRGAGKSFEMSRDLLKVALGLAPEDPNPHKSKFTPKKIIHSGPCTIVFWKDDTKTIVRLSENDLNDEYTAFCAALAIKIFGSNSHVKKVIKDKWEER